jgi:hypothetical protein
MLQQGLGNRRTDAASAAGDERDLPLKLTHDKDSTAGGTSGRPQKLSS